MYIKTSQTLPLILLAASLSFAQCNGQPTTSTPNTVQVESRRLVKSGPDVGLMHPYYADISADGNLWALHGEVLKDISIHDFRTGIQAQLYTPVSDSGWVESMRLSKDGSMIAYADCCVPGYVLSVGTTDGKRTRVVLSNQMVNAWNGSTLEYVVPVDWVRSDSVLTLIQYSNDTTDPEASKLALIMVSVEDGAFTTVLDPEETFAVYTRISPDGTRIMIGRTSVRLLDRRTDTNTVVAEKGYPLGWSTDGTQIYYVATVGTAVSQPGTKSPETLVRRTVRKDGSLGPVEIISTNLGSTVPFAITQDRIYSFVTTSLATMEMISVDLEDGRALSNPSILSKGRMMRWDGTTAAWSSDGLRIAFLEGGGGTDQEQVIVARSTAGNNRREYNVPYDMGFTGFRVIRWHPNNDAIYLSGKARDGVFEAGSNERLVRLNLNSGEFQDLGSIRAEYYFGVSNDGSTVYVRGGTGIAAVTPGRRTGPNGSARAEGVACNDIPSDFPPYQAPRVGDCRTVANFLEQQDDDQYRECSFAHKDFMLSPDGKTLAISTRSCVGIVPEAGGSISWLVKRSVDFPAVNWTPDGKGLVYQRRAVEPADESEDATGDHLVVYDLASGTERVVLEMEHIRTPRLSPDGSRISYRGGDIINELWVMEQVK